MVYIRELDMERILLKYKGYTNDENKIKLSVIDSLNNISVHFNNKNTNSTLEDNKKTINSNFNKIINKHQSNMKVMQVILEEYKTTAKNNAAELSFVLEKGDTYER